ncbi:MAG: amino acid transporter [Acidimicrobiia bacterium]|nr:amino acid transporter [Acidimicrobiia bacterium]
MNTDPNSPWSPLSVAEVSHRFDRIDVGWWVAGGRAIDLFLGWETRPHADLDLEMLRGDRDVLFDVFEGWDLHVVSEGQLVPWHRGDTLDPAVFGVWGRPTPGSPWSVEVMLADGDATTWRYRRDNEIQRPMGEVVRTSGSGVRYCSPEIQLLYKSKRHRPKDDLDMVRCLHRLTADECGWLVWAIARFEPDHPWLSLLEYAAMGDR